MRVLVLLMLVTLAAPQQAPAEQQAATPNSPTSLATAGPGLLDRGARAVPVGTIIGVLKALNDYNKGIDQGKQLSSVEERLKAVDSKLDVIQDLVAQANALLNAIAGRIEEQWETSNKAEVLGKIDVVTRDWSGWLQDCSKKVPCKDTATKTEIADQARVLANAVATFKRRDTTFTNIHLVVLAMGFERDLFLLLGRNKEYWSGTFGSGEDHPSGYGQYLRKSIASGNTLSLVSQLTTLRARLQALESAHASTQDRQLYCRFENDLLCDDSYECYKCLYCHIQPYQGNLLSGYGQNGAAGWARDGQGLNNCNRESRCGGGDSCIRTPVNDVALIGGQAAKSSVLPLAWTRFAMPCDQTPWCDLPSLNRDATEYQLKALEAAQLESLIDEVKDAIQIADSFANRQPILTK